MKNSRILVFPSHEKDKAIKCFKDAVRPYINKDGLHAILEGNNVEETEEWMEELTSDLEEGVGDCLIADLYNEVGNEVATVFVEVWQRAHSSPILYTLMVNKKGDFRGDAPDPVDYLPMIDAEKLYKELEKAYQKCYYSDEFDTEEVLSQIEKVQDMLGFHTRKMNDLTQEANDELFPAH